MNPKFCKQSVGQMLFSVAITCSFLKFLCGLENILVPTNEFFSKNSLNWAQLPQWSRYVEEVTHKINS